VEPTLELNLSPPDSRQLSRDYIDEVYGLTGLAARLEPADRVHLELLLEDILDNGFADVEDDAREAAEQYGEELAEHHGEPIAAERAEELAEELALVKARGIAADILADLIDDLPKRSQASKLVRVKAAELRRVAA